MDPLPACLIVLCASLFYVILGNAFSTGIMKAPAEKRRLESVPGWQGSRQRSQAEMHSSFPSFLWTKSFEPCSRDNSRFLLLFRNSRFDFLFREGFAYASTELLVTHPESPPSFTNMAEGMIIE